jgi:hypothetical protein
MAGMLVVGAVVVGRVLVRGRPGAGSLVEVLGSVGAVAAVLVVVHRLATPRILLGSMLLDSGAAQPQMLRSRTTKSKDFRVGEDLPHAAGPLRPVDA